MNHNAKIDRALDDAFKDAKVGVATGEALRPFAEAMAEALNAEFGPGVNVRAVADVDNSNVVVTTTHHGLFLREQRVVPFDQIGAEAPEPKKRDENPAPEVAPQKKPGRK